MNGHGKLDAFEQLMMERKAIAEAVVKLQELEDVSLDRIKQTEVEAMQRIKAEAVVSMQQIREVEHRLRQKVAAHVNKVKTESKVLKTLRQDLLNRQKDSVALQRRRYEEVAQMATLLAEQQLHIAAERRRMNERQFQLQLSLEDLHQCEKSRSRSSSPQRSLPPYSPHTYAYSPDTTRRYPQSFREERFPPPMSPAGAYIPQNSFSELDAPEQHLPSPHAPQEYRRSPPSYYQQQQPNSPTGSHRSETHAFDKLAPNWHSPVEPLSTRRDLTPPSEQHTGYGQSAAFYEQPPPPPPPPQLPPFLQPEDLAVSQHLQLGESQAPGPNRRVRRASCNYSDGPTNFPNAQKQKDANKKKSFR